MINNLLKESLRSAPSRFYWLRIYLAVALTSAATLLLELSITRIYSVFLYYHFAFLAISTALFGLGVGGLFSYVVEDMHGGGPHGCGR